MNYSTVLNDAMQIFRQMTSRRISCLVEASKQGFLLHYDPPGTANRCFYRCLAKFLHMDEDDIIYMLETFMMENQIIPIQNEVF